MKSSSLEKPAYSPVMDCSNRSCLKEIETRRKMIIRKLYRGEGVIAQVENNVEEDRKDVKRHLSTSH
jgi:hypothetical protein